MNLIERAIAFVAPQWALNRAEARASLEQVEAFIGTGQGYAAGKVSRTKGPRQAELREKDIPRENLANVRNRSWQSFRDDPYMRKAVKAIIAKVIGSQMRFASAAVGQDGKPLSEYRRQVQELWEGLHVGFDHRGMPGQGGTTMAGLQRLALQNTILSGGILYRLRVIDKAEQIRRELPIPLTLQFIDVTHLADSQEMYNVPVTAGNTFYRGIELNRDNQRVRYWLKTYDDLGNVTGVESISASQLYHIFWDDDAEQFHGVSWTGASLANARQAAGVNENVLTSLEMQSCFAVGVKRGAGKRRIGVNPTGSTTSTADDDLTDAAGNKVTSVRPGLVLDLGQDGSLEGFSPNAAAMNPDAFVQHILRGVAAGLPAVKSSTVIGDYRQSSFSSEKSADNDIWPEVEQLQDWFASCFLQPIFSAVVRWALISNYFSAEAVTTEDFMANPTRYLKAEWQGPVAQSINPEKDETAAAARMKNGKSNPQMECRRANVSYEAVLTGWKQFMEDLKRVGLPEEVATTMLGVTTAADPSTAAADPTSNDQTAADQPAVPAGA